MSKKHANNKDHFPGTVASKLLKGLITGLVATSILIALCSTGGCQSDGKLEWSHKFLRKGEGAESRNTGNCQKVYSWGNNTK